MIKEHWWRILCFCIGLACGIYVVLEMGRVADFGSAVRLPIIGVFAGAMMTPLIAFVITNPFGSFFYSEKRGKLEAIYSIPEKHRNEGRYEESFRAYMAILSEDSQRLKAYQGMIDLASRELDDEKLAGQVLQSGLDELQDEKDRESLRELHKAYVSRMHAAEFNQRPDNISYYHPEE